MAELRPSPGARRKVAVGRLNLIVTILYFWHSLRENNCQSLSIKFTSGSCYTMDLPPDDFILSQENEKQDLVTGSPMVFILTSSSSCFLFTPNVCRNIKFRITGTFQSGKEKVKHRDDLCGLSQDQKIFRIGFDLVYPGQYKVVVTFSNNHVTNSPFKFQVSSDVEMIDFKKVFKHTPS